MSTASDSEQLGYLQRQLLSTASDLEQLFITVFDQQQVWAFGGHTVGIQPISLFASTDVPLRDSHGAFRFGHVFSDIAEVRWKYDGQQYDVLVLTEQDALRNKVAGVSLGIFAVRQARQQTEIILSTPNSERGTNKRWRLGYWEYLATNGAVQFLRYTNLRKGSEL